MGPGTISHSFVFDPSGRGQRSSLLRWAGWSMDHGSQPKSRLASVAFTRELLCLNRVGSMLHITKQWLAVWPSPWPLGIFLLASVACTRRPWKPHMNPPFSDMISPFVCAFLLTVKCGCCVVICREVVLEFWKLSRKKTTSSKTSHPMETEGLHLTVHKKALMHTDLKRPKM